MLDISFRCEHVSNVMKMYIFCSSVLYDCLLWIHPFHCYLTHGQDLDKSCLQNNNSNKTNRQKTRFVSSLVAGIRVRTFRLVIDNKEKFQLVKVTFHASTHSLVEI